MDTTHRRYGGCNKQVRQALQITKRRGTVRWSTSTPIWATGSWLTIPAPGSRFWKSTSSYFISFSMPGLQPGIFLSPMGDTALSNRAVLSSHQFIYCWRQIFDCIVLPGWYRSRCVCWISLQHIQRVV